MTSFTEPLAYRGTDEFRGGRLRPLSVDGEPAIELVGARRLVEVEKPFVFNSDRTGRSYAVPAGFRCDLGSIPGFARGLLSPDDPWAQCYVLHDWLYRFGRSEGLTRKDADTIALWDALSLPFRAYREGIDGPFRVVCPALYRSAVYYAVRLGGGNTFA